MMKADLKRCVIQLLAALAILTAAVGLAQEPQASHFYFAQITDTHFGEADHLERARKIVQKINGLPVEMKFVVHTGDITEDLTEDKAFTAAALSTLGQLKAPVFYVAGNHDILPEKAASTRSAYEEAFGGLISKAVYNDVTFIFVCTEPLRAQFSLEGYRPFEQLEQYLKEAEGKPIVIFHHSPSVENFYNNIFYESWPADTRERWVQLINAYNVKAVIAGHFHRDEFHWLGDVPLYVCSSVAGYWGRQATYRIYEYTDGKIEYMTQYIE